MVHAMWSWKRNGVERPMLDDHNQTSRNEAERRLIGTVIEYPDVAPDVLARIRDPRFIKDSHCRSIFTVLKALHEAGDPLNQTSIRRKYEELHGAAPRWLTTELVGAMGDVSNLPSYVPYLSKIILDDHALSLFRDKARGARTFDDAVSCAQLVFDWNNEAQSDDEPDLASVADTLIEKQQAIREGKLEWGYSWGLESLDRHILLQPGKFYTIGGIKKGAKTLFLLSILHHHLSKDSPVPCMLFSIEMSAEEIVRRIFSHSARIDSRLFPSKQLPDGAFAAIQRKLGEVRSLPLTVNQAADITAANIMNQTRRWKFRDRIPDGRGIVAVDFIQLARRDQVRGQTEASAIKDVAYTLARMAKELQVVVIGISQLRNEAEGQEPHLRFLEGSGGIAQASEAIILLDLVRRRAPDLDLGLGANVQKINIIIAAQRSGESGITIPCMADLTTGSFFDAISAEDNQRNVG